MLLARMTALGVRRAIRLNSTHLRWDKASKDWIKPGAAAVSAVASGISSPMSVQAAYHRVQTFKGANPRPSIPAGASSCFSGGSGGSKLDLVTMPLFGASALQVKKVVFPLMAWGRSAVVIAFFLLYEVRRKEVVYFNRTFG